MRSRAKQHLKNEFLFYLFLFKLAPPLQSTITNFTNEPFILSVGNNYIIIILFPVLATTPNDSSEGSWSDREMAGRKLTGIGIKKSFYSSTYIAEIRAR